jgi:hypothetical protein
MKNLNQEELKELSLKEVVQIEGGNWIDTIGGLIDDGIHWISKQYRPLA